MFIRIEDTPNPETLKFIPDSKIDIKKSIFIDESNIKSAGSFAQAIFKIDGVKSILLDNGFISVTKKEKESWEILRTIITSKISSLLNKKENIENLKSLDNKNEITKKLSATEKKIVNLLEEKVKPVVASHGGEISFHSFKEGTVFLELKGSCAGCPSSTATLKMGIENMLKHFIEEVTEVVEVNS